MSRRRTFAFTAATVFFACTTASAIAIPRFHTAADARVWAERQQRLGNFADAAQAYLIEAGFYDRLGDTNAAQVERRKASRLTTDIAFAIPTEDDPDTDHLAKLEPPRGCYIGVRDDFEGKYYGRDDANSENFADRIRHPVAVALDYDDYGRPFPKEWAIREGRRGRAIQIAVEPRNIYDVYDDEYLNKWAEDAGDAGTPIFLRFGGEMNGKWTAWGRSPSAYKRAFRIVHDVMARHAPNVAMLWAPNVIPTNNLDDYYPGDEYVDWVGISFYLVRWYDDNLSRPAWQDSIGGFIDPFYRKYATRKPICLAEFGITRRSKVEGTDADAFASDRIVDLFEAIKIRYPRLKMACFFDRNNLDSAESGRRLNDFSLPEGSLALAAARSELQDPYFLGHVRKKSSAPLGYQRATSTLPAGYHGDVAVSLSTYSLEPWMQIKRGNKEQKVARPFQFSVPDGTGPLQITVYDNKGRIAKKTQLAAP